MAAASSRAEAVAVASEEAPQAAQGSAYTQPEPELLASSEATEVITPVASELDQALKNLSAQRPRMARKVNKAVQQASQSGAQASAADKAGVAKATKSLSKAMDKAAKKFDAKQAKAAQATGSLVALGALLAVGGLVLLLATTGAASTIGLIALIAGLVVLLISVLS
jgi:Flp pilus assembly protein TadB